MSSHESSSSQEEKLRQMIEQQRYIERQLHLERQQQEQQQQPEEDPRIILQQPHLDPQMPTASSSSSAPKHRTSTSSTTSAPPNHRSSISGTRSHQDDDGALVAMKFTGIPKYHLMGRRSTLDSVNYQNHDSMGLSHESFTLPSETMSSMESPNTAPYHAGDSILMGGDTAARSRLSSAGSVSSAVSTARNSAAADSAAKLHAMPNYLVQNSIQEADPHSPGLRRSTVSASVASAAVASLAADDDSLYSSATSNNQFRRSSAGNISSAVSTARNSTAANSAAQSHAIPNYLVQNSIQEADPQSPGLRRSTVSASVASAAVAHLAADDDSLYSSATSNNHYPTTSRRSSNGLRRPMSASTRDDELERAKFNAIPNYATRRSSGSTTTEELVIRRRMSAETAKSDTTSPSKLMDNGKKRISISKSSTTSQPTTPKDKVVAVTTTKSGPQTPHSTSVTVNNQVLVEDTGSRKFHGIPALHRAGQTTAEHQQRASFVSVVSNSSSDGQGSGKVPKTPLGQTDGDRESAGAAYQKFNSIPTYHTRSTPGSDNNTNNASAELCPEKDTNSQEQEEDDSQQQPQQQPPPPELPPGAYHATPHDQDDLFLLSRSAAPRLSGLGQQAAMLEAETAAGQQGIHYHQDPQHDNANAETALQVQAEKEQLKKRKKLTIAIILIMIVVGAAIVVLAVALAPKKVRSDPVVVETAAPSAAPTVYVPLDPSYMEYFPQSTRLEFENQQSVAYRAYRWLVDDPNIDSYLVPDATRLQQRFAMAAFYFAFEGDKWRLDDVTVGKWLNYSVHECDWIVNSCNVVQRVTSLSMPRVGGFAGRQLPLETISFLPELELLNISHNLLVAPVADFLPTELSLLSRLQTLDFTNNRLTGQLPSEVALLAGNLKVLNLQNNAGLRGTIPTELRFMDLEIIQAMIKLAATTDSLSHTIPHQVNKLQTLSGHNNDTIVDIFASLRGTIPTQIALWTDLRYINFGYNSLTGSIPREIGELTQLSLLELYGNKLSGPLPTEYGKLTGLTRFYIAWSLFSPSKGIPTEVGRMRGLKDLIVYNAFAKIGTLSIPSEIGQLASLSTLYFGHNRNIIGQIPSTFGLLTQLTEMTLFQNGLSGSLPSEIGLMRNVSFIDISERQIAGTIPSEIFSLPKLASFALNGNSISGSIPSSVGNAARLESLYMIANNLEGQVPSELGLLSNLQVFDVRGNPRMLPPIPNEICNRPEMSITTDFCHRGSAAHPMVLPLPPCCS